MKCLYLHENCIKEMSGLESMVELDSINLSDNMIETIGGLEN
jgi:hypothetical protein